MKDVSIVLCGQAGQGIQTVEEILAKVLKSSGYCVFSTKEFMSRIRGGSNSTEIRVCGQKVSSYLDRIDLLIPLSSEAVSHVRWRLNQDTVILGESEFIPGDVKNAIEISFTEIAKEIGKKIYANVVAVGTVCGLLSADNEVMSNYIKDFFKGKDEKIIKDNIIASREGYKRGNQLRENGKIALNAEKNKQFKRNILIKGADAVAMGAIAGGCNFISSYPMSPSTGVLVFLAQQAENFGIVTEQAESEISAINMSLGAWYAGGRGMVTTSGGGFALMVEGLSLSGMIETPVVIHLAQRPGPATGLPTRTEQGDLLFSIFAGHGEFPRIVLAPGTASDAFYLTMEAFNLADKFQIPVILLTDQYLIDSTFTIEDLDPAGYQVEHKFIKTDPNYRRYQVTKNGISPRGIPGYGSGIVSVDSDEHDESGHITENLEFRKEMVDKRLRKMESIRENIIPPELVGREDYEVLVIGWGSTYHTIEEALKITDNSKVSFLHFKQAYPLPTETGGYIRKAARTVVVEANATAQFARLIKMETGLDIDEKILKYNGLPFSVEEVVEAINNIL
jgi:2-oxoglutarate ferredoxin oxidoreductase subunit alpha